VDSQCFLWFLFIQSWQLQLRCRKLVQVLWTDVQIPFLPADLLFHYQQYPHDLAPISVELCYVTGLDARSFNINENIINTVIIFICTMEDHRDTRILKRFTFRYLMKFSDFLQLSKVVWWFYEILPLCKLRRYSDVSTLF
jgi:hypothetical protein